MPRLRLPAGLTVLLALVVAGTAAPGAQAATLRTGFLDGNFSVGAVQAGRLAEAATLGADVARVSVGWGGIAPRKPASPTDPNDPAYEWTVTDAAIRDTVAAGIEPLLSLTGNPDWAAGPGLPAYARRGTWRPDTAAYGRFAQALARRYDGTFPDPLAPGRRLPRVRTFLPWNEPNLEVYLAPQWRRTANGYVAEAPGHYRRLVAAFGRGIHLSQPGAKVVAGAFAPFGDLTPSVRRSAGSRDPRTAPALFLRGMLCLDKALHRRSCGADGAPRFDVLSHHPYSVGGPFHRARNRDDVSVPDLAKLTRPLRRAEQLGVLGSKRARPLWVTEFGWDSSPPDPRGVPAARHATWLAQSLYELSRQGVGTVLWYQVRDQPPGPGYQYTSQSGVLRADGRRKPAATAFTFPLVALRSGATTTVWARSPGAGRLVVERRVGTRWATVTAATTTRGRTLTRRFGSLAIGTRVRARQGSRVSLTVTVARRPSG